MLRLTFGLLLSVNLVFAQKIDYKKVILPDNAQDITAEERLVQLAWKNNPANEIYRRNVNIAEQEVKLAKREWLENLGVTGNLNEATFSSDSTVADRFYPRYNLGARISLGFLFTKPVKTKITKERLAIASADLKTRQLEIRARILRLYQEYQMNQKLLRIQNEILSDTEDSYTLYEEKFRNQEISFNEYNDVLISYNKLRLEQANLESRVFNVKVNIEEIIGISLEEALQGL